MLTGLYAPRRVILEGMAKRYVGTGEAAEYLGVTRQTLQRWVKEGMVTPAFRTPRRGDMRWDLDDLDRQLHNQPGPFQPAPQEQPMAQPQPADQPERPSVMVAIVTSRRGVLAGRRNDGKPPWTFIAGENELHERPEETIVREVKEETGLLIKAGATIGERVHPRTSRHMVYIAATAAGRSRDVWVGDPEELAEVRWLTLTEVEQLMPDMFAPVHAHLRRCLTNAQAKGQRKTR
jgi:excisionase family DNA binding protein